MYYVWYMEVVIKVKAPKSKKRNKVIHTIMGQYTDGSYADYIQLKKHYRKLELESLGYLESQDWYNRVEFTSNFLKKKEKECGSLTCVYCGKPNLVLYHWNNPDKQYHKAHRLLYRCN